MAPDRAEENGLPPEFGFIARVFRPLAGDGALDLRDDAAVFTPPAGRQLVVAADAMVEGVHFLPDDPSHTIGRKLLRCNLSDLAAMDATPLGYLLTVSMPPARDEAWFAGFAAGLAQDQQQFAITLLGGDTTATTGPLVLSLTILGHVAPGMALRRNTARVGDGIWVTGTIGDGAMGLLARQGQVPDPDGFLASRYQMPRPRLGLALGGIASAGMDVSDGLVQDLGHMARESGVGAVIEAAMVPLSPAVRALGPTWLSRCLTGGDDYELLLAVPPGHEARLLAHAAREGVAMTRIGQIVPGNGVQVRDEAGKDIPLARRGWSHVADPQAGPKA
ncbi:thiamine-phosphate kinase [Komagataeibacter nataicola]|uniref:Thiamine-monophosphate kinase n=1 Tax=Komagataeibacter nataicola TaxID=265960 RepID=A0A9N7CW82_9PROT|nr:thiamine-phosphate kinase [Komagataeibacter nataicola]AQU88360.1 thiamine-phosphate kinase [Komagataeibacter nataicola]PYD67581.1 thiamine-phosphate kinase [Komagataeibacter nataicola]WEQ54529.1 thiamine-phosphate kinase [Komagataeibacter nataicola]WNM08920.1 thiamine-phosphate kinase [Komagataeibacter nataicola]GBR22912.1 thiamine monophosphate kinase [Komagataeibacter nataicola NRIC 0616]